MKKLFYAAIITLMVAGCNQSEQNSNTPDQKGDAVSNKGDEMKALYKANLAAYKTQIAAFEKEDLNAWAATIADNAVWSSPVYGDTITTKAHWTESTKYDFKNFNNLHLTDAQFLPGIDSLTHEMDGSVRYYGTWRGTHKSGKELSIKVYGTYDFNKDHKITYGDDFYDAGGLMNAIQVAGQ